MQTHEIYFRFDMQKSSLYFRLVLEVNILSHFVFWNYTVPYFTGIIYSP
jgi:hypothetical protein